MSLIYTLVAVFAFIGIIYYTCNFNWKSLFINPYFSLISIAFIVRILASKINLPLAIDISTIKNTSDYILKNDLSEIYYELDFNNFPPVHIFILYIVGFIRQVLGFTIESDNFTLLVKLPAIICDIITGIFVYKLAYKRTKPLKAWLCGLFYVINPAIILISSVWGQYESVYTLFLVASLYYLVEDEADKATIYYSFSILARPMLIVFLPIYLYAFVKSILEQKKESKLEIKILINAITVAVIAMIFLFIPFQKSLDFRLFYSQINDYKLPYATINAFNFFAFIGANWSSYNELFFGVSYKTISIISFTTIFLTSLLILFYNDDKELKNPVNEEPKRPKKHIYFVVASFIAICYFMFTIQIHERYLFPVILLLLVTYIYTNEKSVLILFSGFSATYFVNCANVIYLYQNQNNLSLIKDAMSIFSAFNVILFIISCFVGYKIIVKNSFDKNLIIENKPNPIFDFRIKDVVIENPKPMAKMKKNDYIYVAIIVLVYSVFAFVNLGNTHSAQSIFDFDNQNEIIITLDKTVYIKRIQTFLGPKTDKKILYSFSEDGEKWTRFPEISMKSVFAWNSNDFGQKAKYVKVKSLSDELILIEMGIRDRADNLIKIESVTETALTLFDEQEMVPLNYHYLNSTYFDEVYHPRTAYEFVHKMDVYEWTHPPLGKVIMSWSIMIFGMTPFGWRFAGVFFGVLMIPLIYVFAKKMFGETKWAVFSSILLAADFMHFSQTRLATIDTYVTFFIICMYYYMYKYYRMSIYYDNFIKTLTALLLSGICMGLAIASKWPGVYASAGIAVIFFYTFYLRFKEYLFAKKNKLYNITSQFYKKTFITFACCLLFFIVIPIVIYCLSYIPYLQGPRQAELITPIKRILENQKDIFAYHSNLSDTHPFSSEWWKWPIIFRPIFYYSGSNLPSNMRAGISAFGNPAIWWSGIVATFYCISVISKRFSKTSIFLLISYSSQLLPWALITGRTTYIYHYFPSVPFIILMLAFFFKDYADKKNIKYTYIFLVITVLLFIMFFPVLSGITVSENYIKYFLRWFPSWVLA